MVSTAYFILVGKSGDLSHFLDLATQGLIPNPGVYYIYICLHMCFGIAGGGKLPRVIGAHLWIKIFQNLKLE